MHVLLVFRCGFVVYLPTTGGHLEDKFSLIQEMED